MFKNLSDSFGNLLKKIKTQSITKKNIQQTLQEINQSLLNADVNHQVANDFLNECQEKCLGEEVLTGVSPREQIIKIINDLLVEYIQSDKEFEISDQFTSIMFVGLNGVGKTTSIAKLANFIKKKGKKVLLASCDTYRPAAIEQLKTLADTNNIDFDDTDEKNPIKRSKIALNKAKTQNYDYLLIDTAGRLHIDKEMMQELKKIKKTTSSNEVFLVVDSGIGQQASDIANSFNQSLDLSGLILSKTDNDSRGGAALSIKRTTNKDIKFITTGEKIDDIELFKAQGIVSRILGMGDVVQLVENIQDEIDEQEAQKLEQKIKKNSFNFNDFLKQFKLIKKLGGLGKIMSLLPGGNKIKQMMDNSQGIDKVEAIIFSMTKKERENPNLLKNPSRKKRIALGSGNSLNDITQLINRFSQMKDVIGNMNKNSDLNSMMDNPDSFSPENMMNMLNQPKNNSSATKKKRDVKAERKKNKKNKKKKKK